ncbi:beta-amyrin 28-monooxygenase-like [Papaver somniferum]|uniref:beta-amyrin 28-monooxygenase-like n=1 Tax=Papaver somniferum TaxID=3469 RepID=UPI000E6F4CEA|nr:beta-amyrin 28-monooxygenase-like [Papaver somniferum]
MDSLARKHFDAHWDNNEEVIVYPLIKLFNFTLACQLFLSIEDDSRVSELLKPLNMVVDGLLSLPINLPGAPLNRGIKASKFTRKEFEKMIKQRMDQMHVLKEDEEKKMKECLSSDSSPSSLSPVLHPPAQDILSQMILFRDINDDLVDAEATSAHTEQREIAKSKAPEEWLNIYDVYKMMYSWNVVSEVLRLSPLLQGGYTEALTNFIYAGYFIPKGMKLFRSGISSHMNPENFPDPEKFDPSRFQGNGPAPYTYVPFGGGPGMCPGFECARVQILIFLHHVVRSVVVNPRGCARAIIVCALESLQMNPAPAILGWPLTEPSVFILIQSDAGVDQQT